MQTQTVQKRTWAGNSDLSGGSVSAPRRSILTEECEGQVAGLPVDFAVDTAIAEGGSIDWDICGMFQSIDLPNSSSLRRSTLRERRKLVGVVKNLLGVMQP